MAALPRRCNGSALRSNPRFLDYADRLTIRFARNERSGASAVVIQARVKVVRQECPTLRLRSGAGSVTSKARIKRVGLIYGFVPPTLRTAKGGAASVVLVRQPV